MDDEFLDEYFKSLKLKTANENFINDLKNQMDGLNEEKLEELIKKHF